MGGFQLIQTGALVPQVDEEAEGYDLILGEHCELGEPLRISEAQAALQEIHPGIDVGKRFASMREAFDDSLITGWEDLEGGRSLPDEDDRHVVAAAIKGGAQVVITANLTDFPIAALGPLGLEAVHPDDFLLDQLDLSSPTILQVILEQAAHTRRPPLTPQDLATLLSRAGLPGFADKILRLMSTPLDGT